MRHQLWTVTGAALSASLLSMVAGGVAESPDLSIGPANAAVEYEASEDCGSKLAWIGRGADGISRIWVADAEGTNRTALSGVADGIEPSGTPAWSPEGTRIAWQGSDGSTTAIWTVDVGGGDRLRISAVGPDPDPTLNRHPAWSPDGTRIAWSGHDGTSMQIWVANADGTGRVNISSAAVGPDPDPTLNRHPAWSPDGTRIAWSGHDGTSMQIWVANADGTGRVNISSAAVGPDPDPTLNRHPAWSPDGTRIAWDGLGSLPPTQQIWVANADGTGRVKISNVDPSPDPTSSELPAWSPDGTRIAWSGDAPRRGFQIWVADADGHDRLQISAVGPNPPNPADPTGNTDPTWSPDGTRIAWAGELSSTDRHVWVARADGTDLPMAVSSVGPDPDPSSNGPPAWRICGPPCPGGPMPFVDVPETSFARGDIACIHGLGITTGTGPVTYDPQGLVTREQIAAFLARLWRAFLNPCPGGPMPFVDVPETSFARGDIACIHGLGITTGTGPVTYDPQGLVTREQIAAFLARFWRALDRTCPSLGLPFVDVPETSFARGDIACIHGLGITTGTGPVTYDPQGLVTREQVAAFLARLWRTCQPRPSASPIRH